jgi:hypothetical protein
MKDWRFLLVGLVWLGPGIALLVRPRQMQAASKRFEKPQSLIPCPPLVGVPVWAIQLFGIISLGGSGLFFYVFFP